MAEKSGERALSPQQQVRPLSVISGVRLTCLLRFRFYLYSLSSRRFALAWMPSVSAIHRIVGSPVHNLSASRQWTSRDYSTKSQSPTSYDKEEEAFLTYCLRSVIGCARSRTVSVCCFSSQLSARLR